MKCVALEWFELVVWAAFGILGWWLKSKYEDLRAVEDRLNQRRQEIFTELIEPYVLLLASMKDPKHKATAEKKIISVEYYRTWFHMILAADDDSVRAYNAFMRYIYDHEHKETNAAEIWQQLGKLLLALRKGLGIKHTELDEWDLLQSMLKDAEFFKLSSEPRLRARASS